MNNYKIETRLNSQNSEVQTQESFSVFNSVSNPNTTFEYMGAKYSYMSYNDRYYLEPATNPESVDTLLLPDKMNGKGVAYAQFDLSGYTNLKTLIMFDDGFYCKEVLTTMHLENLYLPVNLNINNSVVGLTADNVYYVGTFDNNYLSGASYVTKMQGLNASHYYYYDWSSIYFDAKAESLRQDGINFEKLPASSCRWTEESFHLIPDFSVTFNKAGGLYVHSYTGSGCPGFATVEEFPATLIEVDSRIKTTKLYGQIPNNSNYHFDLVDARNISSSALGNVSGDIVVAESNNSIISFYGTAGSLYLVADQNNTTITAINGRANDITKIYIPNNNRAPFQKVIDDYGTKVEYYDTLPTMDFVFTDNDGENIYKTRSFDADIDYCLRNIDILSFHAETITPNDYLEDKFAIYDLEISPELQTYTVSFDCGTLTEVESMKLKTLENLPTPNVVHYDFIGWYMDRNFTTPVVEGASLEGTTTLYGKFEHIKYNLRFNTIGVLSNPETIQVDFIGDNDLPSLFTDTQRVTGWYYDNGLTNKAKVGDELTDTTTLYAKWEDLSYVVTFDTNGLAEVESLNVLRLPQLPTPTIAGFEFQGWYYDAELTRPAAMNDALTNDVTLYAKLNEITHTVTFDSRGKAEVASIECGRLRELPEPTAQGFTFAGWFYDQAYTSEAHNGDVVEQDITLYAKWDDQSYLITFNTNGKGTVDSVRMLTVNNLPQPKASGFKFEGWYYDQELTNKVNNGDNLTQNVTLYAKWMVENNGFYIAEPVGIYTSSQIDGKRLISKTEGGLIFKDGVDYTDQASISYAYNSGLDNTRDYAFTLIASIQGNTLTKSLNVKIDNTLGGLGIMIGQDGNIYCGFNYQDYKNLNEVKDILNTFIKNKMSITNPNVQVSNVEYLQTKVYEGTFAGGNIYILASGVNLRYSSATTTVDESLSKQGYTACDRFFITKDMNVEEAIREIVPYILKKDGVLVNDYKVDIKLGNGTVTLKYVVNDNQVKYHSLSYTVIDSKYSYIAGFNTDYHDSVLLVHKTNDDINFNELYKEVLKKGYSYINTLEPEYTVSLKEESTKVFTDTIMRGNGSYYESTLTLQVVDKVKANKAGQDIITMKDAEGNVVEYTEPEKSISDTVNGWVDSFKEKVESNKALKVTMISLGSILGIILIYAAYLLIRKFTKWLKRR